MSAFIRLALASACCLPLLLFGQKVGTPPELDQSIFSGPEATPCPAVLCAGPDGAVYVGVDQLGSLGKGPGKGRIIRLLDNDNDGVADSHTVYATLDNPRGLMAVGNKLFVLYTIWQDNKNFVGMHLGVLEDANGDGKADGPPKMLVSDISCKAHNQSRGADHTTNGIRMGIDGWIYVAVGDFGMVGAKGTDGRTLDMLGGGVVRVRPDGSGLETYCHGLRNIYDVAIDPFMNLYTRGNTNDGGGWNVRFIHEIQSGEYGYPILFKRYTHEILPALVDVGGGSGTGAMFFQEPGWPDKYNNVPLMGDWGRSHLYIHRITADGASFTQEQENYLKVAKFTDVDVDGSGRLYVGSWDGNGYKGGNKGWVARVVPKGWTYKPFPNLKKASVTDLVGFLRSESATWRLHASQELITRSDDAARPLIALINDANASRESRVAAIFTLKQLDPVKANPPLAAAAKDPAIREFCIRAVADHLGKADNVSADLFYAGLKDKDPRVQVAAAVGLGRLGRPAAANELLKVVAPAPPSQDDVKPPKPLWSSGKVTAKKSVDMDVNLEGQDKIYLIVGDAGDGNGNDHAGFFDPVLIAADGSETPLTNFKWQGAKQGWGKTLKNKDCTGKPLKDLAGNLATQGIGTHSPAHMFFKLPKGKFVRLKGRVAGTSGGGGTITFSVSPSPPASAASGPVGPHATPNSAIILPHVAVQSLKSLNAAEACLAHLGTPSEETALWALRYMHTDTAVDGLIAKLRTEENPIRKAKIANALVRLHNKEEVYKGDWWWRTRPDTRGPYYKPVAWEATPKIQQALTAYYQRANADDRAALAARLVFDRVEIPDLANATAAAKPAEEEEVAVDLSKVTNMKGQIGKMAVEDVIIALGKVKGNVKKGEAIFNKQGCIACHTYTPDQAPKGPYMGAVGGILSRDEIAMSILRPNASISQGFHSYIVTTKDGKTHSCFITGEQDGVLTLRTIAGQVVKVKADNVKSKQEIPTSMMPPGLANGLSMQEFADMVDWLKSKK